MMKKSGAISLLGLLFLGCVAHHWADSVITNDSEFLVTFKFTNTGEKSLQPGDCAAFETEAYQLIEYYAPDKRVRFDYTASDAEYKGNFTALPSWTVRVNNALGENVTLSADGWMDEMTDIAAGNDDDGNHTGTVYTNAPRFSATTASGFPAAVTYTQNGSTFLVTIK